MTMNPKERLLGAVADLQRFVIHHPDQARCPVCPRWDELQGAAMQAVTAIDDHKAELAALRAELESAHAAQRHAEKELSQYLAWYAMAEHQHLHEQRRAEKAEAEQDATKRELDEAKAIIEGLPAALDGTPLHNTARVLREYIAEKRAALGER